MVDNAQALIAVDRLSKRYPGAPDYSLSELSLQVKAGEVYGFLGANGAGKSTTIRLLMNFIQPTSGTAKICGLDIVKDYVAIKRRVGYLAGDVALYDKLSGREFLDYLAALRPPRDSSIQNDLIRLFDADPSKPLGTLSKGNRQKFGLIQAFMHEPDVLILDEPTSGLDPLMQEAFFDLVEQSKKRGAGLLISSHNFSEVKRMCDKVGFIRSGKLVTEQTLVSLANKASHTFALTFGDNAPVAELKRLPGAHVTSYDTHHLSVAVEGDLGPLFRLLGSHHVTQLEQQEVNLEQEFMQFYEPEKTP